MNDNKYSGAGEAELGFLKEIVRMLPAGLTVQDAQGELLLVNDVAAAQLGMDGSRPSRDQLPGGLGGVSGARSLRGSTRSTRLNSTAATMVPATAAP